MPVGDKKGRAARKDARRSKGNSKTIQKNKSRGAFSAKEPLAPGGTYTSTRTGSPRTKKVKTYLQDQPVNVKSDEIKKKKGTPGKMATEHKVSTGRTTPGGSYGKSKLISKTPGSNSKQGMDAKPAKRDNLNGRTVTTNKRNPTTGKKNERIKPMKYEKVAGKTASKRSKEASKDRDAAKRKNKRGLRGKGIR